MIASLVPASLFLGICRLKWRRQYKDCQERQECKHHEKPANDFLDFGYCPYGNGLWVGRAFIHNDAPPHAIIHIHAIAAAVLVRSDVQVDEQLPTISRGFFVNVNVDVVNCRELGARPSPVNLGHVELLIKDVCRSPCQSNSSTVIARLELVIDGFG